MESSCCKLRIFDYPNINKYSNILYLDTDVLINSDVNILFNSEISPNKLYALEEGTLACTNHGSEFFDFNTVDKNQPAFSAGVFYFKNSSAMRKLFEDTNSHISLYMSKNHTHPICLDQPFLVYNAVTEDKYDNQLMKNYVENNPSSICRTKIIYHFPGGPGNYQSKESKMTDFWSIMNRSIIDDILAQGCSMVSKDRLRNLKTQCEKFRTTNYSFVECGVAKGGCIALMKSVAVANKVYGFDSFEGMPEITKNDIDKYNKSDIFNGKGKPGDNLSGGIDNVYKTFSVLNIDMNDVILVKGFFKDTLAKQENIDNMGEIAVLRLDGDWYESTKICLEKLYDRVVVGGAIIIDDYGHWVGAKRATDEFRTARNIKDPLIQTDYTGYYWVKTKNTIFTNRNDMIKHYSGLIKDPKVLEIGVFKGVFLDYIIKNCNIRSIDAVDLFEGIRCSGDADGNNVVYTDLSVCYLDLLEKYTADLNVGIYQSDSVAFLKKQDNEVYDIIYLDGDHTYEGVKNDLINSYAKIKDGGYIMGHDYEMNPKKTSNTYKFGVKQAVDEFCVKYKQSIIAKAMDGCVSYCIKVTKQ